MKWNKIEYTTEREQFSSIFCWLHLEWVEAVHSSIFLAQVANRTQLLNESSSDMEVRAFENDWYVLIDRDSSVYQRLVVEQPVWWKKKDLMLDKKLTHAIQSSSLRFITNLSPFMTMSGHWKWIQQHHHHQSDRHWRV